MSRSMLRVHVLHAHLYATCLCPCCMSMTVLHGLEHGHEHTVITSTPSMDMECNIDMGKQPEHGHATCTGTCSMGMYMQHGQWAHRMVAACTFKCPCCMSMSLLHVPVHAAYPCPCCMTHYMLCVLDHAAFPCLCSISMSILHVHVSVAWT